MVIRIPLDNICEKKIGTLSSQYDGEIEYIDISSIDNVGKVISNTQIINAKEAPSRARQLIKNGDILVSTVRPNLNAVAVVEKEPGYVLVASTGYCVLRCNSEVDNHYVFHFCQSPYFVDDMVRQATGASYPAVSNSIVKSSMIPLWNLEKQRHIAIVLDKVNDLIFLRKQQLAKLDELVKARFVEMFGDYRTNDKGFERFKGHELFKFSSGKFLSEEKRSDHGIPVYGGNGIAWYTDTPLIEYPTIIIGRVGAQCGNIHMVKKPVWVTDNAIYIKQQRTDKLCLEFLSELMRMMDFYQYADFSGQPKITQKPLENQFYLTPPIELQKQFVFGIKQIDKQKLTIQQSLDKLEVLKKSLMQEYFG